MVEKLHTDNETFELVKATVVARDPAGQSILVGSAAIFCHFYDADIDSPIGVDDVDVLCPSEEFDRLLRDGATMTDISKFQVRWPKGRLALRGATNKAVDLYPREGDALMVFTACFDMSDAWIPTRYEDIKQVHVVMAGLKCMPLSMILLQIAIIGRDKDIETVDKVLPSAVKHGFISDAQKQEIIIELAKTKKEKTTHPERYYARVDL